MSVLGHVIIADPPEGKAVAFWRQCLRGLSCCAFQTNEITGVIFIIALLFARNWHQAAFFVIAVIVGTITVRLLVEIPVFHTPMLTGFRDAGILGFNSALMGIALGNFFKINTALWVTIVVAAIVVAIVNVILARWLPFPFLAAPFILTFWLVWPLAGSIGLHKVALSAWSIEPASYIPSLFASMASTLFATKVVVGVVFLVGVIVSNWRHALMALLGGLIAVALTIRVHVVGGAISTGYVGFNAVLAALVVCVVVKEDIRLAALAAFIATWIFAFMNASWPAPALASGFVLGVWAVMLLDWLNKRFWAPAAPEAQPAPAPQPTAGAV